MTIHATDLQHFQAILSEIDHIDSTGALEQEIYNSKNQVLFLKSQLAQAVEHNAAMDRSTAKVLPSPYAQGSDLS